MSKYHRISSAVNRPWEMTLEEFSAHEYPPLLGGEGTSAARRVRLLLVGHGIPVLRLEVRGSRAMGVAESGSDWDIHVEVPPDRFHEADDLVAPLSREGIDVLLNWRGVGAPGGTLRGTKTHRRLVEKALDDGRPVPAAVMADYPDLRERLGSAE